MSHTHIIGDYGMKCCINDLLQFDKMSHTHYWRLRDEVLYQYCCLNQYRSDTRVSIAGVKPTISEYAMFLKLYCLLVHQMSIAVVHQSALSLIIHHLHLIQIVLYLHKNGITLGNGSLISGKVLYHRHYQEVL